MAERIRAERTARDWSYARLSEELADVGATLAPAGIYKIETQGREIYVDDMVAFAEVFGCTSPVYLIKPFDPLDFAERQLAEAARRVSDARAGA